MAFRKRNVPLTTSSSTSNSQLSTSTTTIPGTKLSLVTSQPVTSTGTPSLDALLSGHGGLPIGSSLLVEERGTTDFSGALLRFFAAQGICHGHEIHLVGMDETWVQSLPGVVEGREERRNEKGGSGDSAAGAEKMKIAWRYEGLGQAAERGLPQRAPTGPSAKNPASEAPFNHYFDLSKRLILPKEAKIHHYPIKPGTSPFDNILRRLEAALQTSSSNNIHRLLIPTILSPAIYPTHASRPENFLRFLHSLRALLHLHPKQLTAIISLPLDLYPRTSSLVRWAEILSDGVIELQPFAHALTASGALAESGGARSTDDQPQGLVQVQKLPVATERGEGGAGVENSIGADLAFTVSRRKFAIKPFSLPPLEAEEQDTQGKLTGKDVAF